MWPVFTFPAVSPVVCQTGIHEITFNLILHFLDFSSWYFPRHSFNNTFILYSAFVTLKVTLQIHESTHGAIQKTRSKTKIKINNMSVLEYLNDYDKQAINSDLACLNYFFLVYLCTEEVRWQVTWFGHLTSTSGPSQLQPCDLSRRYFSSALSAKPRQNAVLGAVF